MQYLSGVDGTDCAESWCPELSWCFLRKELPFTLSTWLSLSDSIFGEKIQVIHMHRHNKTTTEEPSSDKAEILNTSFAEMALAPSELGDKLSIDEEVVSLLCRKKGFHCERN